MSDWLVMVLNVACVVVVIGYFVALLVRLYMEHVEYKKLRELLSKAQTELKESSDLQLQLLTQLRQIQDIQARHIAAFELSVSKQTVVAEGLLNAQQRVAALERRVESIR